MDMSRFLRCHLEPTVYGRFSDEFLLRTCLHYQLCVLRHFVAAWPYWWLADIELNWMQCSKQLCIQAVQLGHSQQTGVQPPGLYHPSACMWCCRQGIANGHWAYPQACAGQNCRTKRARRLATAGVHPSVSSWHGKAYRTVFMTCIEFIFLMLLMLFSYVIAHRESILFCGFWFPYITRSQWCGWCWMH